MRPDARARAAAGKVARRIRASIAPWPRRVRGAAVFR
jgi:hypothetical protein